MKKKMWGIILKTRAGQGANCELLFLGHEAREKKKPKRKEVEGGKREFKSEAEVMQRDVKISVPKNLKKKPQERSLTRVRVGAHIASFTRRKVKAVFCSSRMEKTGGTKKKKNGSAEKKTGLEKGRVRNHAINATGDELLRG